MAASSSHVVRMGGSTSAGCWLEFTTVDRVGGLDEIGAWMSGPC